MDFIASNIRVRIEYGLFVPGIPLFITSAEFEEEIFKVHRPRYRVRSRFLHFQRHLRRLGTDVISRYAILGSLGTRSDFAF